MKRKGIIVITISAIVLISFLGLCVSNVPNAKVPAMSFLEDVTGYNFAAVGLTYTKVATGPSALADLKAGEYSWCVQGTVEHIETKTRYTVQIYVDELQNKYWRKVSIYMAQGVNVPAMQLTQMYP